MSPMNIFKFVAESSSLCMIVVVWPYPEFRSLNTRQTNMM